MLGDPFYDALLGNLLGTGLIVYLTLRFRYRIMRRTLTTVFETFAAFPEPKAAIANFAEGVLGAYLEVKEVDMGKGKVGKQYVLTERAKAIIGLVAPYMMSVGLAEFKKMAAKAKEGGGGGGGGLGQIIGMLFGGGKSGSNNNPNSGQGPTGGSGPGQLG